MLVRRQAAEMRAGLEGVVIDDLSFDESHLAEIGLEASERSGADVEVGPFALEGVVVGLLEEGLVDEMFVGRDIKIAQSADVAPEAVGEEVGLLPLGREAIGHGQGVAGSLGIAARGEVSSEDQVVVTAVGHPEPAFVASNLALGLIEEEARLSPVFLGDLEELGAFLREEEGGLVAPAGDGVVGDRELIDIAQRGDDRRRGLSAEEGEVERQGGGGGRELHAVPVEGGEDLALDEADLPGIGHRVERLLPGQGDVDLVGASFVAARLIAVAAKAQGVGEDLEDAHARAALRAHHLRVLARPGRFLGDELSAARRIPAPVALKARGRVFAEPIQIAAATSRTTHVTCRCNHNLLLSNGVLGKRTAMIAATPGLERS